MRGLGSGAIVALVLAGTLPALAQTSTAPGPGAAGSARPARGPEQNTLGSPAPAGTGTTTGTPSADPAVRQLNEDGQRKVEQEGK